MFLQTSVVTHQSKTEVSQEWTGKFFFFLNISESEKMLYDVFIKDNLKNREKHKEENKI